VKDFEEAIEEAKKDLLPFESWERLSGESSSAFAAFCAYRDFGSERNIRKAVEAGNEGKPASLIAKRYRQWRQWAMKFQWAKRAEDYDNYLEKLKQGEIRKTIEAQGEKHREVTGKMLDAVSKKLDLMDPAELTQGTVTEWVQAAIKVEREMAGMVALPFGNRANNGKADMKQGELNFTSDFQGC
jgi:hypothetical protein